MAPRAENQREEQNVVISLFGDHELFFDPLQELLDEAELATDLTEAAPLLPAVALQPLVTPDLFPEQSMFIIERQINQIKEKMSRLKFYLDDLDDLLPR